MANNSIRVKSATEYIIEVNDNGDTISFDISDTGLTSKFLRMYEKIEQISKEYEQKGKEIDERPDEVLVTLTGEESDEEPTPAKTITKNWRDGNALIDSFYNDSRAAIDMFMGEGACQKIFGDKNYRDMFKDLIEQLGPHFKIIGINAEKLKTSALNKHSHNRNQRRALK